MQLRVRSPHPRVWILPLILLLAAVSAGARPELIRFAGEKASDAPVLPRVTRLPAADADLRLEIRVPALLVESLAEAGRRVQRISIPGGARPAPPGAPRRAAVGWLV
ncbi:MAG: hypothetical protein GF330_12070, partial [Candidatus Eisenbacteria bacterium]|nr:hypothetical protein [Candidatus Eisenbacteria bacterium]